MWGRDQGCLNPAREEKATAVRTVTVLEVPARVLIGLYECALKGQLSLYAKDVKGSSGFLVAGDNWSPNKQVRIRDPSIDEAGDCLSCEEKVCLILAFVLDVYILTEAQCKGSMDSFQPL